MTMTPTELQAKSAAMVETVKAVMDFWNRNMDPMERLTVVTAVHAFLAGEIVGLALEAGGRAAGAALVSTEAKAALVDKAAKANQAFLDVIVAGVKDGA